MRIEKYVEIAKHAIGMDCKNPYTRHGKKFYKPYRNRFAATIGSEDFKAWEEMESRELAASYSNRYGRIFYLTRRGLDWLGDFINVKIHDEDD